MFSGLSLQANWGSVKRKLKAVNRAVKGGVRKRISWSRSSHAATRVSYSRRRSTSERTGSPSGGAKVTYDSYLLLSNIPPSESEAALTRAAIAEMKAEVQVTETTTTCQTEAIRRHQAILSNIRLIPFEILQLIFTFVEDKPPWAISQVCQPWRNSALALPRLWSNLPKVVLRTSITKTKLQMDMLTELLRRSSNAPLEIGVMTSVKAVKSGRAKELNVHPVIQLLVQHSPRWRVANLRLPEVVVEGLQELKGRLPLLRDLFLSIMSTSDTDTNNGIAVIDTFEVAPELKHVNIEGMYSAEFKLPLSNLVRYSHDIRSPIQLDQFSSCSALQDFTLSHKGTIISSPNPVLISLPRLTKLHLECYFSSHTSFLLSVDLPAIEDIYLSSGSENVFSDLRAMLLRGRLPFSLKKMKIRTGAPPAHNDLTELLQLIPVLSHLDTTIPFHTDISALAVIENDSTILVPHLHTCIFHLDAHPSNPTRRAIRRLASSRCEIVHQINNLQRDTPHTLNLELQTNGSGRPEWELDDVEVWTPILQQVFFEDWYPTSAFQHLWTLKLKLYAEFPEIHLSVIVRPKMSDFKWSKRVHMLLTELENYEVLDPRDLLISNLHVFLQTLGRVYLSKHANPSFATHAQRIFDKWALLIQRCLNDVHWGPGISLWHSSLMYIHQGHSIRSDSKRMLEAVLCGVEINKP